ncbi:tetrapyrrole methylase [Phakopsora pachyrhizi]|uniref:diphthine methyl ester synthase n=1 Tax=Phakopsora pachyrhizi TaxID=170000 RepID=A0AAV0B3Y3_PHAPC|nr:tetrapyrrole methylase [Phakopsora pachyrhizi]CAH7681247.1 tetrapyrrole methylase [Phakopsora pachyrhizi]
MLYLIGLGLSSAKDITLTGLEAVRSCSKVYLENYTSILMDSKVEELEAFYGKSIILTDREAVENESDLIILDAVESDVSFLVVGDPFGATTHTDLLLRCVEKGIQYKVIHNVSILNAVGSSGLSLYNFGQTVSIPFFTESWRPTSWLLKLVENLSIGLHTLCLLDIKMKEQSEENLARGRKIYEPPRLMKVSTAIEQISIARSEESFIDKDRLLKPADKTLAVACCRLGSSSQLFLAGTLEELSLVNPERFGPPLHCLIVLGNRLNPVERDFMAKWAIDPQSWIRICKECYGCHD